MRFSIMIPALAVWMLTACSHSEKKETPQERRNVASEEPRKFIEVRSQSCAEAYRAAIKSPSIAVVQDATDICLRAAVATCTRSVEQNAGAAESSGDGRYVAALCELKAAYGANKAVNQGQASFKCDSAYRSASRSPSSADLDEAVRVCTHEAWAACAEKVRTQSDSAESGDGRWIAASCELLSAHGSYKEVTKKN